MKRRRPLEEEAEDLALERLATTFPNDLVEPTSEPKPRPEWLEELEKQRS